MLGQIIRAAVALLEAAIQADDAARAAYVARILAERLDIMAAAAAARRRGK